MTAAEAIRAIDARYRASKTTPIITMSPCSCDGYGPDQNEKQLSRVMCLLEELDGSKWDHRHWQGYHPAAHNCWNKYIADKMTAELCKRLQFVDVTKYSPEMQIWWRDHQESDQKRIAKEKAEEQRQMQRQAALSKLTPDERKVLGLP